jgi:hypothetical protein
MCVLLFFFSYVALHLDEFVIMNLVGTTTNRHPKRSSRHYILFLSTVLFINVIPRLYYHNSDLK